MARTSGRDSRLARQQQPIGEAATGLNQPGAREVVDVHQQARRDIEVV
jgi:hypothetical protein